MGQALCSWLERTDQPSEVISARMMAIAATTATTATIAAIVTIAAMSGIATVPLIGGSQRHHSTNLLFGRPSIFARPNSSNSGPSIRSSYEAQVLQKSSPHP